MDLKPRTSGLLWATAIGMILLGLSPLISRCTADAARQISETQKARHLFAARCHNRGGSVERGGKRSSLGTFCLLRDGRIFKRLDR